MLLHDLKDVRNGRVITKDVISKDDDFMSESERAEFMKNYNREMDIAVKNGNSAEIMRLKRLMEKAVQEGQKIGDFKTKDDWGDILQDKIERAIKENKSEYEINKLKEDLKQWIKDQRQLQGGRIKDSKSVKDQIAELESQKEQAKKMGYGTDAYDAAIANLQKDDNLPDKCSCGGYFNEIGHEWLGEDKNGVGRSINTERCSRCNKIRQYMIGEDGSVKIVKDSTKDSGPGSGQKEVARRVFKKDSKTRDDYTYPEDFIQFGWNIRQNGSKIIATRGQLKYEGSPYEIVPKLKRWLTDYSLGQKYGPKDSKTKDFYDDWSPEAREAALEARRRKASGPQESGESGKYRQKQIIKQMQEVGKQMQEAFKKGDKDKFSKLKELYTRLNTARDSNSKDSYDGIDWLTLDPLTEKGKEILASMKEQYGDEKGEQIFYASKNAGKLTGVDKKTRDLYLEIPQDGWYVFGYSQNIDGPFTEKEADEQVKQGKGKKAKYFSKGSIASDSKTKDDNSSEIRKLEEQLKEAKRKKESYKVMQLEAALMKLYMSDYKQSKDSDIIINVIENEEIESEEEAFDLIHYNGYNIKLVKETGEFDIYDLGGAIIGHTATLELAKIFIDNKGNVIIGQTE